MKPSPSAIERPPGPHGRLCLPWLHSGIGGALLCALYLVGVNRNLLYLSMLFSVVIVMSVVLRRWWALILGLGACAYLACVPARVPDLGPLYPAPRDIPGAERMWVTEIGKGETWTYHFTLGGLKDPGKGAARRDSCTSTVGTYPAWLLACRGRPLSAVGCAAKRTALIMSPYPWKTSWPGPWM